MLLRNEGNILPIKEGSKVAFIGEFAKKPRFQGGGSSHVNSCKIVSALDSVTGVTFAQGYTLEDKTDDALLQEAVEAAKPKRTHLEYARMCNS